MLEEYKNTMDSRALHLWAADAQYKINLLSNALEALIKTLEPTYSQSPEGRDFIENVKHDLEA